MPKVTAPRAQNTVVDTTFTAQTTLVGVAAQRPQSYRAEKRNPRGYQTSISLSSPRGKTFPSVASDWANSAEATRLHSITSWALPLESCAWIACESHCNKRMTWQENSQEEIITGNRSKINARCWRAPSQGAHRKYDKTPISSRVMPAGLRQTGGRQIANAAMASPEEKSKSISRLFAVFFLSYMSVSPASLLADRKPRHVQRRAQSYRRLYNKVPILL